MSERMQTGDHGTPKAPSLGPDSSIRTLATARFSPGALEAVSSSILSHFPKDSAAASRVGPESIARNIARSFASISFQDPIHAWSEFLEVIGPDVPTRGAFLASTAVGEALCLKLLSSMKHAVAAGECPDRLLAGMREDRERSSIMNLRHDAVLAAARDAFDFIGGEFRVVMTISVSLPNVLAWSDRSRLGVVFIIADPDDRMMAKLRLTETWMPDGNRVWNLGVVAQDPSRPKITDATKYRHWPGEVYPGRKDFGMIKPRNIEALLALCPRADVTRLSTGSAYYHLAVSSKMLGAELDPAIPGNAAAFARLELIDRELDKLGLLSLKARSWAVHENRVPDPDQPSRPLSWIPPRFMWRVGE